MSPTSISGAEEKQQEEQQEGTDENFHSGDEDVLVADNISDQLEYNVAIAKVRRLRQRVLANINQHRIASEYYAFRQYWIFFLPSVFLSLVISVLSFLSNNADMGEETSKFVRILAGILSLVVASFATIGQKCQYGEHGVMHQSTADNLRNLEVDLDYLFDVFNMHGTGKRIPGAQEKLLKRQNKLRQIEKSCKSPMPMEIKTSYDKLETKISDVNEEADSMYQDLFQFFITHPLFPFFIPNGERAVNRMVVRFNNLKARKREMERDFFQFEKVREMKYKAVERKMELEALKKEKEQEMTLKKYKWEMQLDLKRLEREQQQQLEEEDWNATMTKIDWERKCEEQLKQKGVDKQDVDFLRMQRQAEEGEGESNVKQNEEHETDAEANENEEDPKNKEENSENDVNEDQSRSDIDNIV